MKKIICVLSILLLVTGGMNAQKKKDAKKYGIHTSTVVDNENGKTLSITGGTKVR